MKFEWLSRGVRCLSWLRPVAVYWRIAFAALLLAPVLPVAGAHAQKADYRINPGDELDVYVWGEDKMQRTVRVQPDGTFAFPLTGSVQAAGLSTTDITADIRTKLADKYRGTPPDVTVSVKEAAGQRFFVLGKVRNPGTYGAAAGDIDIVQALSMAGGLAEFADVKNAVILRKTPEGQTVEKVQLARILKGGRGLETGKLAAPLPTLRSGDVLVVP